MDRLFQFLWFGVRVLLGAVVLTGASFAQVTVVSSSSGSSATTTLSINLPASTAFADLLVAQIVVANSGQTITAPSGWTLIRSDNITGIKQSLYYKAINPSLETGAVVPYQWSFSSPATNSAGVIIALRGTDLLSPITAADSGQAANVASITAPGVSTTVANAGLIEFFAAATTSAITLPAGAAPARSVQTSSLSLASGFETQAYSGSSGSRTATVSLAAANVGQMVAVRPMVSQCFTDDFEDATILDGSAPSNNWVVAQAASAANYLPNIVTTAYSRRLRMTSAVGNEATFAALQRSFPAAGNLFTVEFNYYAYGGTGADGLAVTLSDASVSPVAGSAGGSLGYAQYQSSSIPGFAGGWLGIGFDEYGNFSTNDRGHCGWKQTSVVQNSVALRGMGSGFSGGTATCTNYPYLMGTNANAIDASQGGATGLGRKYRVTVDSRVPGSAMTKVEVDTTGTGSTYATTLIGPTNVLSATQTLTPANFRVSFTSSTGGSTNIHEIDNLKVCSLGMTDVRSIDHIRFYFDQAATACQAKPVTVRACRDNACSSWYTPTFTLDLTTSPVANTGWSQATGVTITGGNNSTLTFRADNTSSPRNYTLGYSNPSVSGGIPGLKLRCFSADGSTEWTAGNNPCNMTFTEQASFAMSLPNLVSGINAVAAGAANTGKITATSSSCGSGTVPTAFKSTTQPIKFWYNYIDPLAATVNTLLSTNPPAVWVDPYEAATNTTVGFTKLSTTTPGSGLSLYFNASGVAQFDFAYPDSGKLQLNAQYGPTSGTTVAGNAQFVAVPDHFTFTSINRTSDNFANPAAANSAGAAFAKAGEAFKVTLTAQAGSNATTAPLFVSGTCGATCYGSVTKLFGNETVPEGVSLIATSPIAGLTVPSLSFQPTSARTVAIPASEFGSGGIVNDPLGVATVTDLAWGEVGIIQLTADFADGSYLGAGHINVTSRSPNIGRFYPDHFDTAVTQVSGVPMACPDGLCPATYNGMVYSGQPYSLTVTAKNTNGDATSNYSTATGYAKTTTLTPYGALGAATAPIGAGNLGVGSVTAFAAGTLTEPAEKYTFTTVPTAPTNIYIYASDGEASSRRAVNPTTTSVEGGVRVASGRIRVPNVYGSELLPFLPSTATIQYYDGASWVTSATDSASLFAFGAPVIIKGPMTTLTEAVAVDACGAAKFCSGQKTMRFSSGSLAGSANILLTAPSYLPSDTARATFGIYKSPLIYRRENY